MSYAKASPPVLPNLFKRTRLFDLLDQYRNRRAIWIQGQAGSGKTTLIAGYIKHCGLKSLWYRIDAGDNDPVTFFHYFRLAATELLPAQHKPLPKLTPELLPNLEPFSRFFFRELFEVLPRSLLLVFDNYQMLSADSPLNQIIAIAVGETPRGMRAVLISRCPPPRSLSRMQFNRTLALLDQRELRLTDEEVLDLLKLWRRDDTPTATVQQVNELVDGWIAGLVLLLEHGGYDDSAKGMEKEYFFSYFASEIFDTLDADRQRFLLYTACLDNITADVARKLTGMTGLRNILDDLCQRNYFTTKSDQAESVYRYHPLFRDFLRTRGKSDFGKEGWRQIAVRAAQILADTGQTDEAIELAITASDWSLLSILINRRGTGHVESAAVSAVDEMAETVTERNVQYLSLAALLVWVLSTPF